MQASKKELILKVLRKGRMQWADLERELVKSGKMASATLSNNLKELEKDGMVRRIVDETKRPASVWYVLADFRPLIEEKVEEVVEVLRREFRFFREPTIKEVALRVDEPPEVVRPLLFRLAPKTGWKEQTEEEAEKEAEAINLAGWLKWLQKGEQNTELNKMAQEAMQTASGEILERARKILETSPELAPDAEPSLSGNVCNMDADSRSTVRLKFAEATMLFIFTSGFLGIIMPFLVSSLITFSTAFDASFSDLPPAQIILPERKIKVAVFGFFSLKTSPGNRFEGNSALGKPSMTESRFTLCPNVAEATTFTTLTVVSIFSLSNTSPQNH
ncbi:MAG: winged helix-turn-helix transcriptional regulator [Candidatus Bathyarchaeia archaeon]|nr:winged helix-turn-helix transcriptional regulator [Candidatus Bathyarchaeia archaeon]